MAEGSAEEEWGSGGWLAGALMVGVLMGQSGLGPSMARLRGFLFSALGSVVALLRVVASEAGLGLFLFLLSHSAVSAAPSWTARILKSLDQSQGQISTSFIERELCHGWAPVGWEVYRDCRLASRFMTDRTLTGTFKSSKLLFEYFHNVSFQCSVFRKGFEVAFDVECPYGLHCYGVDFLCLPPSVTTTRGPTEASTTTAPASSTTTPIPPPSTTTPSALTGGLDGWGIVGLCVLGTGLLGLLGVAWAKFEGWRLRRRYQLPVLRLRRLSQPPLPSAAGSPSNSSPNSPLIQFQASSPVGSPLPGRKASNRAKRLRQAYFAKKAARGGSPGSLGSGSPGSSGRALVNGGRKRSGGPIPVRASPPLKITPSKKSTKGASSVKIPSHTYNLRSNPSKSKPYQHPG